MANKGKDFEEAFNRDFRKIEGSTIIRLYDTMGGYKGVDNPCDFVCYIKPRLYLVECKSIKKDNTFNFKSDFRQYDDLKEFINKDGVVPLVTVWFVRHFKVCVVKMSDIVTMREVEGLKSINVKNIGKDPRIIEVPIVEKKRVNLVCDYSILKDIPQ